MKIVPHKNFTKSLARLSPKMRDKVQLAIHKFKDNPHDLLLRNHPLKGSMQGTRAFSVTGNLRVIFKEYEHYTLVLLVDVGTHNQVY